MTSTRFLLLVLVGCLSVPALALAGLISTGYEPRPPQPSAQVLVLQSRVATLEAALYRAEAERCEDLGVHPVPAGRRR